MGQIILLNVLTILNILLIYNNMYNMHFEFNLSNGY